MNNLGETVCLLGQVAVGAGGRGGPDRAGRDFLLAPTEQTMGDAQRIVYIHVAVAWMALGRLYCHGRQGGMYSVPPRPGLGPLVAGRAWKSAGCAAA